MTLKLSADQLQIMQSHAQQAYPHECCGLLVGTATEMERVVVEVRSIANSWSAAIAEELNDGDAHSVSDRYWIDPAALLQTMRHARSQGLEIVGAYHSHPDHPAAPSECDRALAWEEYSYIIISVRQGRAREFYSWKLDADRQFQQEEIVMVDGVDRA